MATGVKKRNSQLIDGVSFMDKFGITLAAADKLTSVQILSGIDDSKGLTVHAAYTGASAITLTDYNGFPVGSVIIDFQAFKIHLKTGATTWKSSAAFT